MNFSLYNWWKDIDKFLFFLIILLISLGIFFSLVSTSLIASTKLETTSYYFFFKQFIYTLLGICTIFFFSLLEEKTFYKLSLVSFLIIFCALILVPIIGVEVKGSKRWLDIFFFPRFQPIEILKPFLIIILSMILTSEKYSNKYARYLLSLIAIIPIILLLFLQPDIGQTLLVLSLWLSLIFVSGINLIFLILFILIGLCTLFLMINFIPKLSYIKFRIDSFFDLTSKGNYQSERASEAIMNGGFFGKGIGEGTLNVRVPEAHTDYVIAVIAEEFGIISIIGIILIFLCLIFRVFKKVSTIEDECFKLILVGSVMLILFQVLVHIGVNIRFLPTTGMTLPFLSYGGSSIIGSSILIGIILNLTKRKIKK